MATTSQLRISYPEFIVNASIPTCDFTGAVRVAFPAGGASYPSGRVMLRVHPKTRQAWRAVAAVMLAFGYAFVETAGGTLACRKITGGTGTTLHAHGIAGDWNPSKNRYRVTTAGGLIQWGKQTDMPAAMVRAIEAIKLTNGLHPIEWGGRWVNIKDPMHYQFDVLASQLQPVNLATLPPGAWAAYLAFEAGGDPGPGPDPEPEPEPGETVSIPITPESHPEEIRRLQWRLNLCYASGLKVDGDYGPVTSAVVADRLLRFTGADEDPNAPADLKEGRYVNALMWEGLDTDKVRKVAPAGAAGDVSQAELDAAIASVRADTAAAVAAHARVKSSSTVHPHTHAEGQTGPPV